MTAPWIAVGSCSDAFALAPLGAALARAGRAPRLLLAGDADLPAAAAAFGLPAPTAVATLSGQGAARLAQATGFAAEWLAAADGAPLVTLGHGTLALAAGMVAARAGRAHLRLHAGERAHDGSATDRDRRLADHTGTAWACASELQAQELRREGLPAERIRVTGSLLPAALQRLPAAPAGPGHVWLALEHQKAPAADLAALLQQVLDRRGALPVRTAAGMLPAGIALPAGLNAAPLDAVAQLAAARAAAVIVTDSAGYQDLAAALGVPCLLLRHHPARPDLVASGHTRLGGPDGRGLPERLDRLPRPAPLGTDALPGLLDLLGETPSPETSPPAAVAAPAPPPPAALGLPSDTDHTGRTLGAEEIALCSAVLRSGTLNSTRGTFVARAEREFAHWLGRKHVVACASGSAAVHCAIAALQLAPGDEVVTTPITDMGAITPILYEGGIPVFADVEPRTLNVTAATIRAQLTARTRAIVVTHLFGLPCDLGPILQLAQERGLPVIEDTAQAFGATWQGRKLGTLGAIGTFSLQQGKHITTGEGGFVATDDDALARRLFLCVNKAWGYGDPRPDHYFPALNYRLSELQGAVAVAQLPKLDAVVAARRAVAAGLRDALAGAPGLHLPADPPHGTHSYWKFPFFVDPARIRGGGLALGKRMQACGVACAPRYIQKPAFACELFRDWRAHPVTALPLSHSARAAAPMPLFAAAAYPGAQQALDEVVVLPINERYTAAHVQGVASVIRSAVEELRLG